FVALTLTPMMCSRLLKRHDRPNWFYRKTEPFFEYITDGYRSSLESFLKVRWVAFFIIAFAAGGIFYFMKSLPSELSPDEDRNGLRVNATGPEGASYEFMDDYMNDLAQMLNDSIPGLSSITSLTRSSNS